MKKTIIFLCIFGLSSCGFLQFTKVNKAQKNGRIATQKFKSEVHFQFLKGDIIIPVEIEGKTYNFILDTGASCMIDGELAKVLSTTKIGKSKHIDVNNHTVWNKLRSLPSVTIGDVKFQDFAFSDMDFKSISESTCMPIHGFIGRNLLRHAIWQINYAQQTITFSDQRNLLWLDKNTKVVPFYGEGTPIVRILTDSTFLCEAELDTGSNGDISIPQHLWADLPKSLKYQKRYGLVSGAFSTVIDTVFTTKVPNLTLGNQLQTHNTRVSTSKRLDRSIIGNAMLQNYLVTIDWPLREILFSEVQNIDNQLFEYGFVPGFYDGKVVVSRLSANTIVAQKGLKIYDQILKINDIDTRNMSAQDFCGFPKPSTDEVILVVLKDGKEMTYRFPKTASEN